MLSSACPSSQLPSGVLSGHVDAYDSPLAHLGGRHHALQLVLDFNLLRLEFGSQRRRSVSIGQLHRMELPGLPWPGPSGVSTPLPRSVRLRQGLGQRFVPRALRAACFRHGGCLSLERAHRQDSVLRTGHSCPSPAQDAHCVGRGEGILVRWSLPHDPSVQLGLAGC